MHDIDEINNTSLLIVEYYQCVAMIKHQLETKHFNDRKRVVSAGVALEQLLNNALREESIILFRKKLSEVTQYIDQVEHLLDTFSNDQDQILKLADSLKKLKAINLKLQHSTEVE